jgi:preprotein translocase subunit SecG
MREIVLVFLIVAIAVTISVAVMQQKGSSYGCQTTETVQ